MPFFWVNFLWLWGAILNNRLAFHTVQLSDQFRDSGSQSVAVQFFYHLQVCPCSLISLVLSSQRPQSKLGNTPWCVSPTASISSPATLRMQVSPRQTGFPALGGEGAAKLQLLTWLSSKSPTDSCGPWCRARGTSCLQMQSPYRAFLNVLCNLWLPNFIVCEAVISFAVQSVLQKIS